MSWIEEGRKYAGAFKHRRPTAQIQEKHWAESYSKKSSFQANQQGSGHLSSHINSHNPISWHPMRAKSSGRYGGRLSLSEILIQMWRYTTQLV